MVRKSGTFVPKVFQNPQTEPPIFGLKLRISHDIQCGDFLQEKCGLPRCVPPPWKKSPKANVIRGCLKRRVFDGQCGVL